MPAQYEHIRDRYVANGMDYDKAQRIAAATYNKQHPDAPMSAAHPEGLHKRALLHKMGSDHGRPHR